MNIIKKWWYRFRSAITGRYVKKEYADKNKNTTIQEKYKLKTK